MINISISEVEKNRLTKTELRKLLKKIENHKENIQTSTIFKGMNNRKVAKKDSRGVENEGGGC